MMYEQCQFSVLITYSLTFLSINFDRDVFLLLLVYSLTRLIAKDILSTIMQQYVTK